MTDFINIYEFNVLGKDQNERGEILSGIPKQRSLMKKANWDCLFVLDACRFDYFEKVYEDYISGELLKVKSPGSSTGDWLKELFGGRSFDEIIYVSANPFVNSKGVEVYGGFNGIKHFHEVIDVWEMGWDDQLKTIPPGRVGRATRVARAMHPNKKLISHFMQPHAPYLSLRSLGRGIKNIITFKENKKEDERGGAYKIKKLIARVSTYVLSKKGVRRIVGKSRLRDSNPVKETAQEIGIKGLRKAYEKNLRAVLEEASKTARRVPGKVVITSDHGEYLGENELYEHLAWCEDPILREVPWLEVED